MRMIFIIPTLPSLTLSCGANLKKKYICTIMLILSLATQYYSHAHMHYINTLLYSLNFSVEAITLEFNISSISFIDGSVDNPRCFQFDVSVSQDYNIRSI